MGIFFPQKRLRAVLLAGMTPDENNREWGALMILSLNAHATTRLMAWRGPVLLLAILLLFVTARLGYAQTSEPVEYGAHRADVDQRIRRLLTELNGREAANASNRELGHRWMVVGYEYSNAGEFTNSESAYNRALDLLGRDPADASLNAEATDQLGALYRVLGKIPESMNCRRKALELRRKLGDPRLIALSESHVAEDELLSHQYREAVRASGDAYDVLAALEGGNRMDSISALLVRAYAECGLRRHADCLADAERALALSRGAFPEHSAEVAASLVVVSFAQLHGGEAAEAEESIRQALGFLKTELSAGDPRVTGALAQERNCLVALHRKEEARQVEAQLEAANRQSAQICAGCTVSAFGLMTPHP